jgi:hypothetical protein
MYALSTATGRVDWDGQCPALPVGAPDEQNVSAPLTGLATSGGLLVVPAGRSRVAFR